MATSEEMMLRIRQWVSQQFASAGVRPASGSVDRITREVLSGQRTQQDVTSSINWVKNYLTSNNVATDPGGHSLIGSSGGGGGSTPTGPTSPSGPTPTADPVSSRNWRQDAEAMYPWLTAGLLDTFASQWADTGNANLALNYVRQTSEYARVFPGIKRDDGSLRMGENEYFATKSAFTETLAEFGRNPGQWQGKYEQLFRQDVSAQEFYRAVEGATQRFVEPGAEQDNGLVDEYLGAFFGSGSAEAALEDVRDSKAYDRVFEGNRRDDGTLRMDEPEYFAYQRGWRRMFLNRGLNPEPFEGRGRLVDAVEAEVSIQELDGRMSAIEENVLGNRAEVGEWFREAYGEGYAQNFPEDGDRSTLLAMAIDPEVGKDVLSRRITASQIGGEAAVQGFRRNVDRAEELARAGVSQSQARSLYGEASQRLPGLSATVRRFNRGAFGLTDYEDAAVLGDAEDTNRLTRSLQSEQSSFSTRLDARSNSGFGLSGLRQR